MAGMNFKVKNEAEKELFKKFAGAKGMSFSSWVRSLMFHDIATTEQSHLDKIKLIMERGENA